VIHYHGTPVTPRERLYELAGQCFCVSFSDARDVEVCHEIGQSVMLDNGAYSAWTRGDRPDWEAFAVWAHRWLEFRTTWAVMPDAIDGDEAAQERLSAWLFVEHRDVWSRCAPVWHMHESLERLRYLCLAHDRVCIGSSRQYRQVGFAPWHRRMEQAMSQICPGGRVSTWLHMLRGMSVADAGYPFASVDSTDVARNHSRPGRSPSEMAARWNARQAPRRWAGHVQQAMQLDP
jgi:hypothetical protein